MNLPNWPGWHLIGRYPEGDDDGVGSWLLHHGGEAMLLEVPPGLRAKHVTEVAARLGVKVVFATASHDHEDHFDLGAWRELEANLHDTLFLHPARLGKGTGYGFLSLGGEQLWLLSAPKHSSTDTVTVFRGVAMTGDIELGQLASVNREVPARTKAKSMALLRQFSAHGYHIHSVVSAHLNDVRQGVDWPALFSY